jgi:colicin import membrane protein
MPGEGPRGERRSRRGADDDLTEDVVGEKRKRIHDEPGYVPDPEALARELRAKRAKEEAAKKSAAERAAAEREAAAAAAAAVTEAAEAAANAAAGGTGGIERAMSADGSAPMQFLDAIDPASDAEIAASSSAFVNFLVKRCAGKPVADAEALATDLGRCVKGALSRDASRTTDWTRHLQGVLQGFMSARTA